MQAKTKSPDEYCRICGMVLSCNRVHIFQMERINRQKIFKLMPFKISKDDGLPQDCCYKCNDTLKHFITFVDRSWYIQKTFLRTVYKDDHESNKHVGIHLPREWYCDSSEDQDTTNTNKETQNKLSESQESASDLNNCFKQDKAKENNQEEPGLVKEKENHENESKYIQTKENTESMPKGSTQLSEESDTTTTTNVSSQDLHGKEKNKRKLKQKFKRANPFCDRKSKTRRKRHEKKRKVEGNTENSVAANKRSRNPRSRALCQLVDNGKVTFVQRPSTLKCPNFIMSRIPNFGLIYCCKKCPVIYTTEAAAEKHHCEEPFRTTSSNKDESSQPPYICEICNLKFLRRVTLEHHLFSHVEGLGSDVSDEDPPTPQRSRQKARHSSESSVEMNLKRCRTSSESEGSSGISESDVDTDNFVVDDDFVEYN
uniref:Uncharacterized protein n=1 Tax=Cacopsylla melanoneura TaxID=428564 RepID=A0A8D8SIF8_9HEMI